IKGEGGFELAGHRYPFRIAANRAGDAGMRVRLNLDPVDRPVSVDVDTLVVVERGVPSFEGTLQINRAVGRAVDGIVQPWRLSSPLNITPKGVAFHGAAKVEARDPRALAAWLPDRTHLAAKKAAGPRGRRGGRHGRDRRRTEAPTADTACRPNDGRSAYGWR